MSDGVFQLIFVGTELELLLELVVLLVDVVSLLLLSAEVLLKSANFVLFGKKLMLKRGYFLAGGLMLWLFWLLVLGFRSVFDLLLFWMS